MTTKTGDYAESTFVLWAWYRPSVELFTATNLGQTEKREKSKVFVITLAVTCMSVLFLVKQLEQQQPQVDPEREACKFISSSVYLELHAVSAQVLCSRWKPASNNRFSDTQRTSR